MNEEYRQLLINFYKGILNELFYKRKELLPANMKLVQARLEAILAKLENGDDFDLDEVNKITSEITTLGKGNFEDS